MKGGVKLVQYTRTKQKGTSVTVHDMSKKRKGAKHRREVAGQDESIIYDPIETATHLMVEHVKAEAGKTGHTLEDGYADDLLRLFGEELRHSVNVAITVAREPLTSPDSYIVFDEDGNPRVMTILP